LAGIFNVPIGSKSTIVFPDDDFRAVSQQLQNCEIVNCDFETTIRRSVRGDFIFADPPYTTAHNFNGFVKYNESIFSWNDQIRLRDALVAAAKRGVQVLLTNAAHKSVRSLYDGAGFVTEVPRFGVISGSSKGRGLIQELVISLGER